MSPLSFTADQVLQLANRAKAHRNHPQDREMEEKKMIQAQVDNALSADVAEFQSLLRKIPKELYEPLAFLMVAMHRGVLSVKQGQEAIASGKGPAEIVGALTVEQYQTCCREGAKRRQTEELSSLASARP